MQLKPLLALLSLTSSLLVQAQQKGYYRTPSMYGNTVIFTAEGDLWKYDMSSGITARLTSHPGLETNPVISPDGKQVVFLGQYEGVSELYLMDINGGVPKRLTYDLDPYDEYIASWTKDGKIIYRTQRYAQLPSPQLIKLDPVTRNIEPIPLWQASEGCYDDAGMLFFTRLPNQGSKTKRYKGGFIEQIWKFDGKHEATNLTADFDGTSTNPMLFGNRIFFVSDRDGTMNIWSMDKDGKDLRQQTFSKGWDIQSPSMHNGSMVYQKGADLYLYDIASKQEKMLDINLLSDFDQRKPKWIKSPVGTISYTDISPNGNYAAIISRGRLFVSPSKSDRWVEVIRKSGIRFREVHFINDKSLAVLSDESGEFEVWKINADGSDSARQLTKNSKTQISSFAVSPNGKYVACTDKNDVLRITDVATGVIKFKYDSAYGGIFESMWSPDSRFLNFTHVIANQNSQICSVDMHDMKIVLLTTSRLNSYNPSWSADSNWLYFVSERNLKTRVSSPWGSRQPEPYYTETANIYAMQLDSAAKFPFLQKDSWLADTAFNPIAKQDTIKKAETKNKKGKAEVAKAAKEKADRAYNWERAKQLLYEVPIKSANLNGLAVADGYLYWLDMGNEGEEATGGKLFALKIEESKKYTPAEIASGVSGFRLSANKKKLLVTFMNKGIAITDANGQKLDMEKAKLELNNWSFLMDPTQDWKQMFADAWRMMRDYFYDRDLHKVDWAEVRKRYEPLVERVTDRYELDDLLAQMVGELSALHTFVYGGDKRKSPDIILTGFLGARLKKDSSGLKIEHIYKSDPDYPAISSPLNKPELMVKEGETIVAVNNEPIKRVADISELLANKVGIPVKLSLLHTNGKQYEQVIKPISVEDDYNLRYGEWELSRREKVDSLGHNDIGYVHLQAMGGKDMDEFVKQFYPVFDRKGLIIDVRHNFGGNIDSWVLEKLLRKAWMYWQGRSGGPFANMPYSFTGHMVILCDQVTSSDGEAVTEGFRRLGLGKVIGMRTWGGEIWLSMDNRLVDNGIASAAELGVYGNDKKWLIEGHGVDPDFVVDNLPFESYKGKDAQLEFAIDYLQKKIKAEPVGIPAVPPYPNKYFKY